MSLDHEPVNLHRLDLNLLVAFDTLVRERNVTNAARHAGVTQSAMSHTLRRLRELFDDPLLVRGRAGMLLTPRAEQLIAPLRSGLTSLSHALGPRAEFVPRESRRVFRLVSPDLFDLLALPLLLARLGQVAPGVDLAVHPTPPKVSRMLEDGEIDLAIVPVLLDRAASDLGAETGPQLKRRTLFRDTFCCFVRDGHPALDKRGRLSVQRYAALAHVLVSPTGTGPGLVDRGLEERGLERRIALRVPHFSSAVAVVASSDLVLSAPSSLAAVPTTVRPLVSFPVPLALPEHAITMVWHPRFSEDPAHRWLREIVAEVAVALPTVARRRSRKR